jgi:hypothetical protein
LEQEIEIYGNEADAPWDGTCMELKRTKLIELKKSFQKLKIEILQYIYCNMKI